MKTGSAILAIVALGFAGCGSHSSEQEKALPTLYIVESGKTGWVKIYYNRPNEKALPVENGFAIARIGDDLKLYTRNHMNPSWDGSQFYAQGADGKRIQLVSTAGDSCSIWGRDKITDAGGDHEDFFVGDQQEFSRKLQAPKNVGSGFPEAPADPREAGASSDTKKVLTDLPSK